MVSYYSQFRLLLMFFVCHSLYSHLSESPRITARLQFPQALYCYVLPSVLFVFLSLSLSLSLSPPPSLPPSLPLSVSHRSLDHCACSFRVLYRAAPAQKMWDTRHRTCARVFSAVNRSIDSAGPCFSLSSVARAHVTLPATPIVSDVRQHRCACN